jgi:hypothetical protein
MDSTESRESHYDCTPQVLPVLKLSWTETREWRVNLPSNPSALDIRRAIGEAVNASGLHMSITEINLDSIKFEIE